MHKNNLPNNLLKEETKCMENRLVRTPINEFVHILFCESKIPRSLITQQESVPAFKGLVSLKK